MPIRQDVASIVSTVPVSKPYLVKSFPIPSAVMAKTSSTEQKVCIHFCLHFYQCLICSKNSNFSDFVPIYPQVAGNELPIRQEEGAGKMSMEPVSRPNVLKSLPISCGVTEPTAVNQIPLRQPLTEVNGRKVLILKIVNRLT